MLMLTTYDFARLFGGGIGSTILGEMDRLCSLTIERSLSTLLISSLKGVKSGMDRLCPCSPSRPKPVPVRCAQGTM